MSPMGYLWWTLGPSTANPADVSPTYDNLSPMLVDELDDHDAGLSTAGAADVSPMLSKQQEFDLSEQVIKTHVRILRTEVLKILAYVFDNLFW